MALTQCRMKATGPEPGMVIDGALSWCEESAVGSGVMRLCSTGHSLSPLAGYLEALMSHPRLVHVDVIADACPMGRCDSLCTLVEKCSGLALRTAPSRSIERALTIVGPCTIERLRDLRHRPSSDLTNVLGIFCRAQANVTDINHCVEHGMNDFASCESSPIELALRIDRLLTLSSPAAVRVNDGSDGRTIVGQSTAFLRVLRFLPMIVRSDATVLISGETGTGKEVVARAIHYGGPREGHPFVPVNCGALPEQLFENELFGHVRGAFTDAGASQRGLLAEAEGGTLFLDEVDSLTLASQVKLLRFLQERTYRALGSPKSTMANVRVIAATNSDLKQRVESREFRDDLYHRLNVLPLSLPPLRERVDDIPLLAEHFLRYYGAQYGRAVELSASALQRLLMYEWPGNIRELEGVIQRAVLMTPSGLLEAEDFSLPTPTRPSPGLPSFREAKTRAIADFDRSFLVQILTAHHGNVSHAARAIGKDRRALQRLIKKYGLHRSAFNRSV
jgi:two-component system response regulator GlrR